MKKTFLFLLAYAWLATHAQTGTPTVLKHGIIPYGVKLVKYEIDSSLNNVPDEDGKSNFSNLMGQGQQIFQAVLFYSNGDTTAVVAMPDGTDGYGLRVIIIGDSCGIFHYAAKESIIPPRTCSLLLSKKPPFPTGETIWGRVGFEGQMGNGTQFVVYGRFSMPCKNK